VLRIPPQRRDLVTLCLDLQAPARLLQVAAMAAIASHHIRLALFPLRLDTDRTGYVDIPHSLVRQKLLLTEDVNTIRATNNAIFNDIFWVHLAYVTAEDGIERLRALLQPERHYAPSCRLRDDRPRTPCPWRTGWRPQRLDRPPMISFGGQHRAPRARAARLGATQLRSTLVFIRLARLDRLGHELRGAWSAAGGCVLHLVLPLLAHTRNPARSAAQTWPRITRFDDRWRWLVTSVVPQFRRFDADTRLVNASLRHIFDEARDFASTPASCHVHPQTGLGELRNRGQGLSHERCFRRLG
jgi:hypothetical protein